MFQKTTAEKTARKNVAETLKNKAFWKHMKLSAKVLSPIIKSMRQCDSKLPGKPGLLFLALCRLQDSVASRVHLACEKITPGKQARDTLKTASERIQARLNEPATDHVRAACVAHPLSHLLAQEDTDTNGPKHKALRLCKPSFFEFAREDADRKEVQNAVIDFLARKWPWFDGSPLRKCKTLSLEAFWEEVSMVYQRPLLSCFMLDCFSLVVDSADSERLWCIFQSADPKESPRSCLLFATEQQEVGIGANIALKKFVAKQATLGPHPHKKPRLVVGKTPSDPAAHGAASDGHDYPSEDELQEPALDEDENDDADASEASNGSNNDNLGEEDLWSASESEKATRSNSD